MTIRCAQGTVMISSALTVGQTVDVTTDGAGVALTDFHLASARAVIFKWNNRIDTGSSAGDLSHGTGFATGSAARRAYAGQTDNGVATTASDKGWDDDAVVIILDTAGAVVGLVDYNGEVTNGFQLIVDDQLPANQLVTWFAIWGDELSHTIHDFVSPSGPGNVDYVVGMALNTGADDKAVIFVGGPNAAAGTYNANDVHMLGFAAGNTPANYVLANTALDAQTSLTEYRYHKSGECIAVITAAAAIGERAALTQWNSDGFRLNWTEFNGSAGLYRYSALVLKGPQFLAGDILSRTDTTQTDEAVGFDPLGLIALSHSASESTADTPGTTSISSVGFVTSATSRSACCFGNVYNAGVNTTQKHTRTDAFYIGTDAGGSLDALADIVDMSVGGGGFTFVMDDVDTSGAFIGYLAVGDALTVAAGSALHETSYPVGFLVDA